MLNTLSKIDVSKLPPQRIEQINALTRSQFPLAGKLKRQEEEIQAMSDELQDMKNGKVAVSDTIYPGVRVFINSVLKFINRLKDCRNRRCYFFSTKTVCMKHIHFIHSFYYLSEIVSFVPW
jgi:uncharacterized protein (DUF342 family)